jgi:hypothetical protein
LPRNGVADQVAIGFEGGLCGIVAFDDFESPRLRAAVAHRWIDAAIATGDMMPCGACQLGKPCHEGAANAEDMNMHVPNPS